MLNQVVIMGRLTRDPELRYTQSQIPVASFTVAVDRDFSGRDGAERQTDFIDCTAWRNTAEFISKYFQKGSAAAVAGSLHSRKWDDKDGNHRISWEIDVDHIYFAGSKPQGVSVEEGNARIDALGARFGELVEVDDGELPY